MEQQVIPKVYFAFEVHGINSDVLVCQCCFFTGVSAQHCFRIIDTYDRLWFCKEVEYTDTKDESAYAEQFFRMGYLAHKFGIKEPDMMFYGNAENEDDLREKLSVQA